VIALNGVPPLGEIPLSNATLEALLDLMEGQVSVSEPAAAPAASLEHSVFDALRRRLAAAPERSAEPLEARGTSDIDRVPIHGPPLDGYE
jgi:hypothetical protein